MDDISKLVILKDSGVTNAKIINVLMVGIFARRHIIFMDIQVKQSYGFMALD